MTPARGIRDWIPALDWMRGYRREWLRGDVVAGLTAAAIVLPKAMAYATIADLPVQIGLYTALVPMVVYALLGTSRPLSVSTTTTIAILTAAELGEIAPDGDPATLIAASAALAMLVGAMLVLAFALRLGFVADFISEPVLVGFKSGIGLVIVVDQLPKLLGVHISKAGFFRDIAAVIGQLPATSIVTLALALAILLLIYLLERFAPRLPVPLVAIAAAIAVTVLLHLPAAGVAIVGAIPRGLPTPALPNVDLLLKLWPAAAGIALMSFTETIAAGRAFNARGEPRPQANQELLALGLANAAGSLFGAMPAGGGTSQTAVNRHAGAHTQAAELVTAGAAFLTLLLLAPVMEQMPQAALAAVVIAYSVGLIDPAAFVEIRRVRGNEFRWALVALAGVVFLGTLQGIIVAVVISLVALAQQEYNPPVYAVGRKPGTAIYRPLSPDHPGDETWPGLLIVRIEGRLFFANVKRVGDLVKPLIEATQPRVLVLDLRAVIDIEYTALKELTEADEELRQRGVALWLAALNPHVRAMVERAPLGRSLGRERMFADLQTAVKAYAMAPAAVS